MTVRVSAATCVRPGAGPGCCRRDAANAACECSTGTISCPHPASPASGGTAKSQRLAERFPNSPADFTLLYLGSTWLPRDLGPLLRLAERRDLPIVLNQDGIAYPGWAGDATEELNAVNRRALQAADHVLYQSRFSKDSADLFLGEPPGSWEILYNAVDVDRFTPAAGAARGRSGPPARR